MLRDMGHATHSADQRPRMNNVEIVVWKLQTDCRVIFDELDIARYSVHLDGEKVGRLENMLGSIAISTFERSEERYGTRTIQSTVGNSKAISFVLFTFRIESASRYCGRA